MAVLQQVAAAVVGSSALARCAAVFAQWELQLTTHHVPAYRSAPAPVAAAALARVWVHEAAVVVLVVLATAAAAFATD